MASYLKKEISEWNTTDLCNWLLANKFRGISELCQKYSLSGYDLFFINDDILKNELGLKSFHERNVALKLFTKLTYEHLRLNVINSNGDNVILTLDNNQETQLGELADYIGNMFNINPKDILFKDNTKQEVLSPSVKIVKLLILYPKIYKVINVSNMKDYHQADEEMMESGDFQDNNNNNMKMNKNYKKGQGMYTGSMGSDMAGSGEMDFQELGNNKKYNNNNYNIQNNNGNNNNRKNKMRENEQRGNMRQENEEFMNYKYNNNLAKMNQNNLKIKRQQKENNENYYYDEEQGNENENDMNRMNKNANVEYNEEYQNNNRGKGQMGKQYNMEQNERPRQNYQYQGLKDKNVNYNEESNFGLMSSGNDDEMKFKPSYQLKNMEYDEGKQNYENN
jgi:hypothetical protein